MRESPSMLKPHDHWHDGFLRDLHLFCTVARRASFITASADTGVSPSHVSKRIALLEKRFGVRLFVRTTRRVSITTDGEAAFQWAQKILDDVQTMSESFTAPTGAAQGLIRIAASQRLGREHVTPILSALRKRHPGLEVWLELLDRRVDLIAENFDIDLRVGEVTQPHLIAHKIVPSIRILCASPDYLSGAGLPRTVADLAQHDCLLFRDRDQRFGVWRLQGPEGEAVAKVTGTLASNYSDVVRQWALDGHGIVMVSVWDAADSLKTGRLVRVLRPYHQPADIWAVTAARSARSAKVRVCIEYLREHLTCGPHALITNGPGID